MNKPWKLRLALIVILTIPMIGLFQNCSSSSSSSENTSTAQNLPATPENYIWLEEAVPTGLGEINYFKTIKPQDMAGVEGYRFIYSEYMVNKCITCHKSGRGQMPQFGVTPLVDSYDIAKRDFYTSDILVRITNNPHCPQCNLDTRGEVYQAFKYWLDHR